MGHGGTVLSAAFSPDGTQILTSSADRTARLWDLKGTQLALFADHKGLVRAAAFSPDGARIVTVDGAPDLSTETLQLWDTRRGTRIAVMEGHHGLVTSLTFNADGSRILSSSRDLTARLWDGHSGAEIACSQDRFTRRARGLYPRRHALRCRWRQHDSTVG